MVSGTVAFSLEIELGWGLIQMGPREGLDRFSPDRRRETETLERLLALCDDLELPISFDVVGHLLLASCEGTHDGPHADGWFDIDPGTDVETDPLFYAPDLVEAIRDAAVDHEICTHTFSHVRCGSVSEAVLAWELSTVKRRHEGFGLQAPTSLVPPVHDPPPSGVLADHGIRTVRRADVLRPPVATPEPPSSLRQRVPWHVNESYPYQVLARSHPIEPLVRSDGVLETVSTWHTSLTAPFLPSGRADDPVPERLLPTAFRQWLHARYLRDALRRVTESRDHAHLWSHLFDLSNDAQWAPVASFLRDVADRRDNGDVVVRTMDALEASTPADRDRRTGTRCNPGRDPR